MAFAVGLTGTQDVQPFTVLSGSGNTRQLGPFTVADGAVYTISARATNGFGLTTTVAAPGVTIILGVLHAGVVFDGITAGQDVDVVNVDNAGWCCE